MFLTTWHSPDTHVQYHVQGVQSISFLEKFVYVPDGSSLFWIDGVSKEN